MGLAFAGVDGSGQRAIKHGASRHITFAAIWAGTLWLSGMIGTAQCGMKSSEQMRHNVIQLSKHWAPLVAVRT